MVAKILQSDGPKWGYAHLTIGSWKVWNEEIGFQSLQFIIGSMAYLAKKRQNYTTSASNFDLKLSQ